MAAKQDLCRGVSSEEAREAVSPQKNWMREKFIIQKQHRHYKIQHKAYKSHVFLKLQQESASLLLPLSPLSLKRTTKACGDFVWGVIKNERGKVT